LHTICIVVYTNLVKIEVGQGLPMHEQIKRIMEERILTGTYPAGKALPPEQILAGEFNVTRMTLRHALEGLKQIGLVQSRRGQGTFVTSSGMDGIEQSLLRFYSFGQQYQQTDRSFRVSVLEQGLSDYVTIAERYTQANSELLENLKTLDPIFFVLRIRYLDEIPFIEERSFLPVSLFPDIETYDFASSSLYHVLQNDYGRTIGTAREYLEPYVAQPPEAERIAVAPGTAVFRICRYTMVRTDIVRFYTDLL